MAISLLASCGAPTQYNVETNTNGLTISEKKAFKGQDFRAELGIDTSLISSNVTFPETLTLLSSGDKTLNATDFTYTRKEDNKKADLIIPAVNIVGDIDIELSFVVQYVAISEITAKFNDEDNCTIKFDYFDDNQYVATFYAAPSASTNEERIVQKIYHIIEKTDDNGYIDYEALALPNKINGDFEIEQAFINAYDVNGKIIKQIGLYDEKTIEEYYTECDYSKLPTIELQFSNFAKTKYYYISIDEYLYDANYNEIKKIYKIVQNNESVLELSIFELTENVYEGGLNVKSYKCVNDSTLYITLCKYDAKSRVIDYIETHATPKGKDGEFKEFIEQYDIKTSSFNDYAPGFIVSEDNDLMIAYVYKDSSDSNVFETEEFQYNSEEEKYFFLKLYMPDFGSYWEITLGENGNYTKKSRTYEPPIDTGKTRDELEFIDLSFKQNYAIEECAYDQYQNCIKDFYTYYDETGMKISPNSFEFTISDERVTKFSMYQVSYPSSEIFTVNNSFEYTEVNNDYGQSLGWVYVNIDTFHLPESSTNK